MNEAGPSKRPRSSSITGFSSAIANPSSATPPPSKRQRPSSSSGRESGLKSSPQGKGKAREEEDEEEVDELEEEDGDENEEDKAAKPSLMSIVKARLQYAKLKVESGWTEKPLVELENTYLNTAPSITSSPRLSESPNVQSARFKSKSASPKVQFDERPPAAKEWPSTNAIRRVIVGESAPSQRDFSSRSAAASRRRKGKGKEMDPSMPPPSAPRTPKQKTHVDPSKMYVPYAVPNHTNSASPRQLLPSTLMGANNRSPGSFSNGSSSFVAGHSPPSSRRAYPPFSPPASQTLFPQHRSPLKDFHTSAYRSSHEPPATVPSHHAPTPLSNSHSFDPGNSLVFSSSLANGSDPLAAYGSAYGAGSGLTSAGSQSSFASWPQ